MTNCNLHDTKSHGRFFTWNNKQAGDRRVFKKIDRALCNEEWEDVYSRAEVTFLPEGDFDHSPVLIHFFNIVRGKTRFKFCNYWASKPNFLEVVEGVWKTPIIGHMSYQINQKLLMLKNELKKQFHRHPIQVSLLQAEKEFFEA